MKLTDRAVANLKPRPDGRYERFDDAVPGLAVRVNSGSKSWVLFYRDRLPDASGGFAPGTRLRRWTLGTYPALTLAAARTKAQRALRELDTTGADPAVGKREARSAQTFGELAADYMERHAKRHKKSWREDQRQLSLDVLPCWKSRLVKTITRRDVHDLLDGIVDRGAPVTANRVLALVSTVFMYGIDKGWLDGNPATRITKQPEKARERVLNEQEVKALWTVLEAMKKPKRVTANDPALPITPMVARGLQLILRTAQRGGEVFTMRWDDVDEASGWWTIPGERTKNGEAHRVPLTQAALALIAEVRTDGPGDHGWVFAAQRGGCNRYQAANVISRLRHAGLITGDYTRHDFRRTVTTGMAREGISRGTISQVINHVDGGPRATMVYDRYSYDREKREALETWGRCLDAMIGDEKKPRTLRFPARRSRR